MFTVYRADARADAVLERAVAGLRRHAAELVVVVNGALDAAGIAMLESLADRVIRRPNTGFDVAAQRNALLALGEGIARFDEVLLVNDTWYGPMTDFDALFARMDATPADFWGLTEHAAQDWIPRHLQSYWFAARRPVVASETWRAYWRDQPTYATYWDAVIGHELALTGLLESRGFVSAAAFPADGFGPGNATIVAAAELVRAGCPILKKRVFFFDPPELARRGGDAGAAAAAAVDAGYPAELLWDHLVRTVAPATLAASCGLVEIVASPPPTPPRARVLEVDHDVLHVLADAGAEDWDAVAVLREADGVEARHAVRSLVDGGAVALLLADPALGLILPTPPPGAPADPLPSPSQRAALDAVRAAAGIRVPLEAGAPLRARAGMWVARPAMIARVLRAADAFAAADPADADYALGAVLAAAAAEEGLRTLSITTTRDAERSLAFAGPPPEPIEDTASSAAPAASRVGRLARRLRR